MNIKLSYKFYFFIGVGSTGAAALNLNRRFTGIELDKEYYSASVKRLEKQIKAKKEQCYA